MDNCRKTRANTCHNRKVVFIRYTKVRLIKTVIVYLIHKMDNCRKTRANTCHNRKVVFIRYTKVGES